MAKPEYCPATGKIVYRNPQRAWTAVLRVTRRSRRADRDPNRESLVYQCPKCHFWHTN